VQKLTRAMVPGNIALLELANGSWTTQALYAAASLGIPDELAQGPLHADEVARRVGADPDAVYRLMRALAGKGVLELRRDARFALTPIGAALRSDTPGSMSAMATDPVLAAYDFSEFRRIVDVGGGHGGLLAAILQRAPDAHGVLFDLPSVVDGARPVLDAAGLVDRCTVSAGSFFEAVPENGDGYLLKTIIHDWDEESALRILRNIRTAMAPRGKLLLLEMVLPQGPSSHFGTMLDLEMLVNAGGKERTRADYADLLARAGFRLQRVVETAGPLSIVEATAD
jgi:hypothetical protein